MTYCVGMHLNKGLVMVSDSRTNAGVDHVATFRKMNVWCEPGERVILLMTAGNLAITQAVVNLLHESQDVLGEEHDIMTVPSMFAAARLVGKAVREVYRNDGDAMRALLVDKCGCHGPSFDREGTAGTLGALQAKCEGFIAAEADESSAPAEAAAGTTKVMAAFQSKQLSPVNAAARADPVTRSAMPYWRTAGLFSASLSSNQAMSASGDSPLSTTWSWAAFWLAGIQ